MLLAPALKKPAGKKFWVGADARGFRLANAVGDAARRVSRIVLRGSR